VLWDVLMEMGYETEGLYIDLGIEGYSERSKEKVLAYAAARGRPPSWWTSRRRGSDPRGVAGRADTGVLRLRPP